MITAGRLDRILANLGLTSRLSTPVCVPLILPLVLPPSIPFTSPILLIHSRFWRLESTDLEISVSDPLRASMPRYVS